MRYSILTIIVLSLIWNACVGLDEIELLDLQDELTLLNEEKALASAYNDSLASYINLTGISTDVRCQYFDEHFHLHDSLYNEHHNSYHPSGSNHHNMGGGMHGQNQQNNSQGGLRSCQENDDFMDSLRHAHLVFHPEV